MRQSLEARYESPISLAASGAMPRLSGTPARLRKWPTLAEWILYISISLCILDGAIRKWVLRDVGSVLQYAPYFAKDAGLVALAFFCKRLPSSRPAEEALSPFLKVGLSLCVFGAIVSAGVNLSSLNLVGAALTIRSMVILPLLTYMCISKLRGLHVERVAIVFGLFTILNAALGTLQYSSPIDDPINYYASKQYVAVAFEENVRAMGTFPYITGFGTLAMVGAWAGSTLIGYATRNRRYLWFGMLVYCASVWSALLSISRAAVLVVIAVFGVWILSGSHVIRTVMRAVLALAVFAVVLVVFNRFSLIQKASDVLIARNEAAGDTFEERVLFPITDTVEAISAAPFGVGLGSEQVGGVFAETGVMSFRQFEAQFPRIVLETGVIGLFGFLVIFAGALACLYRAKRRTFSPALSRSIGAAIFLTGSLMFINVIFDHVASFFAWVLIIVSLAASDSQGNDGRDGGLLADVPETAPRSVPST